MRTILSAFVYFVFEFLIKKQLPHLLFFLKRNFLNKTNNLLKYNILRLVTKNSKNRGV